MADLEGRFQRLYEIVNGEPTIPSRLQTLETQVHDLRVRTVFKCFNGYRVINNILISN